MYVDLHDRPRVVSALIPQLRAQGHPVDENHDPRWGGFRAFRVAASHRNELGVGAWFYHIVSGRLEVINYHAHSILKDVMLPPTRRPFLGIHAPFPRDIEQYVITEYGSTWNIIVDCKKMDGHNCAGPHAKDEIPANQRPKMRMKPLPTI